MSVLILSLGPVDVLLSNRMSYPKDSNILETSESFSHTNCFMFQIQKEEEGIIVEIAFLTTSRGLARIIVPL